MSFVHLHVHSEYSLLDGACRIDQLPACAKSLGQSAIAITDHGVMYGAVGFYKAAVKAGVKPIIGCEVYVAPRSRFDKEHGIDSEYTHLVLLCENETGYKNLCYLVSRGFIDGFYTKPRIDWALLAERREGLICLSACIAGEIPRQIISGEYEKAREKALELYEMFGPDRFYLELQSHGMPEEEAACAGLLRIHRETGIPLAATNDAHYLRQEDSYNQDVLLCIQTGKTVNEPDRMRFNAPEYYLKTEEQMRALFPDHPQAIENTQKIADMCDFSFEFGNYHLPKFELPPGEADGAFYLTRLCREGLSRRYGQGVSQQHRDQLDYEIKMIVSMGFADYFLIVNDFISFAKSKKIPVGPGRGSAAGSLVSYCLGITDVDPFKYSLLFERFLNPERVSMPDIDIDFCVNRRWEVMEYVSRKYGTDHVAQIVTFGTMAARAAIRDVGRALNVSYAETDAVAKQVPLALNMKLDEALKLSKPLREYYQSDQRIKQMIDTARALEGMPRHASTHAAGVVITEAPLYEYVPLAKNDEAIVCQYPMTTLEELGLLKMDFLGLRNLTVLEDAARLVRQGIPDFDVNSIPENDPGVFEMLTAGKTLGVFQMESAGITGVCMGLKPQSMEDITAIIALYRPGPMDSIPRFIECKNNPEKISYRHPLLEDILKVTYGCIVYQEQVIEIFRQLAGFSLGQADLIRRAMSKKKEQEILREKKAFIYGDPQRGISGALSRGVSEAAAESIYDEILDFANYAFNKSHAVSYAVISYRTAYMKRHHTREYMAALLTSVLDSTKIAEYIAECKDYKIRLLPPDINESADNFTVSGDNLRFGLAAIKNIGRGFIRELMRERAENGKFKSMSDFCRRMHGKDLNRRAVEGLIRSGAMDSLGNKRSQLLRVMDSVIESVSANERRNIAGQMDMFEMDSLDSHQEIPLPDIPEFSPRELMAMEKDSAGLYFSGHPMDEYRALTERSGAVKIGSVLSSFAAGETGGRFRDNQQVKIAGVVSSARTRTTRNNSLMSYILLEDDTGVIELLAFQKALDDGGSYVVENAPIIVTGRISVRDEKEPQIVVDTIRPMSDMEPLPGEEISPEQKLYVRLPHQEHPAFERIELILQMFPGNSQLVIYFQDTKKRLVANCLIHRALVEELTEMLGSENVIVK